MSCNYGTCIYAATTCSVVVPEPVPVCVATEAETVKQRMSIKAHYDAITASRYYLRGGRCRSGGARKYSQHNASI